MPTALITGITGQDGRYLAELLLQRGYRVAGVVRRDVAPAGLWELPPGAPSIALHRAELGDAAALRKAIEAVAPDEVYHLAGPSGVEASWTDPAGTAERIAVGTAHLLEAVRRLAPRARTFVAGSSEIFDPARESPQRESTPVAPRSPYGAAKAHAHALVGAYRTRHGMFACSGILYNHESPRRGPGFVTQRIAEGVARIAAGESSELRLGRLEARRDWGFAGDYVDAMWRMLQAERADDYVVASGESHAVEEFAALAFARAGLDWRAHVRVDPALVRPPEPGLLVGDASRARTALGWTPTVPFESLVHMMVDSAMGRMSRGAP